MNIKIIQSMLKSINKIIDIKKEKNKKEQEIKEKLSEKTGKIIKGNDPSELTAQLNKINRS